MLSLGIPINYVPLNVLVHAVVQGSHMFKLIIFLGGKICSIQKNDYIYKFIYVIKSLNKLVTEILLFSNISLYFHFTTCFV